MNYYIISLNHTQSTDNYITLWRPNNAGYCYSKEMAGLYSAIQTGYHDENGNMPITEKQAGELFITVNYDGHKKQVIPNCKAVWNTLNVKMVKNSLVAIKDKQ